MATTFQAEITQVQIKKLVSGDKEYRVTLITNDPNCINLQKHIAEEIVFVEVSDAN